MWIQINIQCNIQRQFWVVCVGYRRVFCKELNIQEEKNTKKNNSKIQNLNCRVWKIKQVGFAFILQIGSCFSKWTWGWLSGSFLNLFFIIIIIIILHFWNVGFVLFLHFEFLICLIRMFLVFCIFWEIAFVLFFGKKKYNTKLKKKQKQYNTNTLCIFSYLSITSKKVLYFFLYVSIPSQIALCPFVCFVL